MSFQPDGGTFKSLVDGSLTGAAKRNPPSHLVFEQKLFGRGCVRLVLVSLA